MSIKNLKSKKFEYCSTRIISLLQNKDEDYSNCEGEGKDDLSPVMVYLLDNTSESTMY